jgi:hypothetical protein
MSPTQQEDKLVELTILQKIFGSERRDASQEEVVELTNQFYVTLRSSFAKAKQGGDSHSAQAVTRIEELLEPTRSKQNWTNAYEIEQLLVQLYDEDTLATELNIRVLEARSVLRPELVAVYDAQVREAEKSPEGTDKRVQIEKRRTLLARLINDLQWRYIVNEATRRYSKLITRRTAYLSVGALVAFAVMIGLIVYSRSLTFTYGDLRLLPVAALAGAWGATFSMLATLKGRLDKSKFDDLKLMRARAVLISRALIGAGAACILFFFLLSGLLGGTAFPTLIDPATAASPAQQQPNAAAAPEPQRPTNLPTRDLALMIVWCFLAGFSEQLIPGLLATTEAKANATQPASPDRQQPTNAGEAVPQAAGEAKAAPAKAKGAAAAGDSE